MIVVDASAWALAMVDPKHDARAAKARRMFPRLEAEHELIAPTILGYELANLVHAKLAFPGGVRERQQALQMLLAPVTLREPDWKRIGRIAEEHRLSAYDAAYLELAERTKSWLLTEDERLAASGVQRLGRKRVVRLA